MQKLKIRWDNMKNLIGVMHFKTVWHRTCFSSFMRAVNVNQLSFAFFSPSEIQTLTAVLGVTSIKALRLPGSSAPCQNVQKVQLIKKPINWDTNNQSLNCFNNWFLCVFLEQISTKNVRRATVSHTEAQYLSQRAALAVSRGTLLLLNARSTMPGDLTLWSRGWAATASAGRHATTW